MNYLLKKIESIMQENRRIHLPEVEDSQLEEGGGIYYMNGRNGTHFDWFVNRSLPNFMMFYDDESNLGALKLALFTNGEIIIYVYKDFGKTLDREIRMELDVSDQELWRLVTLLNNQADRLSLWDVNIHILNTDVDITDRQIVAFCHNLENDDPALDELPTLEQIILWQKNVGKNQKLGFIWKSLAWGKGE